MSRRSAVFLCFLLMFWQRGMAAGAEESWQAQWTKTLQAAGQEGEVVLYASESNDGVLREFQKQYPGIKVSYVAASGGGSSAARILSERRAGKYLVDIYISGAGTAYGTFYPNKALDPIKPTLILPEVIDESRWWSGRHIYHDKERSYILAFNGVAQSYFGYNNRVISPRQFRSYWDLLDPKWKGKMVSYDPTMRSGVIIGLQFVYHHPKLGPEFLRRLLSEMDLTVSRDDRQIVDWLAVGKFPLYGLVPPDRSGIYEAKRQGLPIGVFDSANFREGIALSPGGGNIALFSRAPHPNAAKVLINWLLSQAGQITYQKLRRGDIDSLRIDIPKDDVAPEVRRNQRENYFLLAGPGLIDLEPVQKIVQESWRRKR